MRILVDENFPRPIVRWLRDQGHDVLWAAVDLSGWQDLQLLEIAEEQGRILFTLDKDFRQIAEQRRAPLRWSGVVLFRLHPSNVKTLAPAVLTVVEAKTDWRGHVTVVTRRGVQRTDGHGSVPLEEGVVFVAVGWAVSFFGFAGAGS